MLLSVLFLTLFVGIFLVFRIKNRKSDAGDESDDERIPILRSDP